MKIITLIENTSCDERFACEHGLSLYIETARHKILFDAGKSGAFAVNAGKLGVDLSAVDIAVLSHGHYDHGGGLAEFMQQNSRAPIYLSKYAFEAHLNATGRDIGLNKALQQSDRLIFTDAELVIDEELALYTCNDRARPFAMPPCGLSMVEKGERVPEDFRHEQYLLIRENGRRVLISGCSHKGILNIAEWFRPDVLIGGFHFMEVGTTGDDAKFITDAAQKLCAHQTQYYTGHCTGQEQYRLLKSLMGSRVQSISSGDVLEL